MMFTDPSAHEAKVFELLAARGEIRETDADRLAGVMMRHTTTLGIRRIDCGRYVLNRRTDTRDTPFGPVRRKEACGMGVEKSKPEFDDLARIARERDLPLSEVRREIGR